MSSSYHYRFFSHRFTRKTITYFSSGRQSVIHCKHHFLSRFVESLVCRQVYTQIRCYRSHFGNTARSSSILLVRLIIITASHTQESSYQIYYFFILNSCFIVSQSRSSLSTGQSQSDKNRPPEYSTYSPDHPNLHPDTYCSTLHPI